jgi:endoglucanase
MPTVTNVSPNVGPVNGVRRVRVFGTGFTSGSTITFNGASASSLVFVNSTELTCIPPHGSGDASVIVTDGGVSNAANSAYTYGGAYATGTLYRGINRAGAEYGEAWDNTFNGWNGQTFYTWPGGTTLSSTTLSSELTFLAAKGMNVVRLPIAWERLQHSLLGAFNTQYQTQMTAFVSQATAAGWAVLVDLHNYNRYAIGTFTSDQGTTQSGGYVQHVLGDGTLTNTHLIDVWTKLSTLFKTNNRVFFNLMNEPHDFPVTSTNYFAMINDQIAAIRANGAMNLILVPNTRASDVDHWSSYPGNQPYFTANGLGSAGPVDSVAALGVVDSANNFAFDMHAYLDNPASGTDYSTLISNVTSWATTNNRKLFLSELGTSEGATNGSAAIGDLLSYMNTHSDVWLGWTAWNLPTYNLTRNTLDASGNPSTQSYTADGPNMIWYTPSMTPGTVSAVSSGGNTYDVVVSDAAALTDSVVRARTVPRTLGDTVPVVDAADLQKTLGRSLADVMFASDSYLLAKVYHQQLYDTVAITDASVAQGNASPTPADYVDVTDTLSLTSSRGYEFRDSLTLTDSVTTDNFLAVQSATALTSTKVRVVFSDALDFAYSSTLSPLNYMFDDGLAVYAVSIETASSVVLDVAVQVARTYTLTVGSARNESGSVLDASHRTATFAGSARPSSFYAVAVSASRVRLVFDTEMLDNADLIDPASYVIAGLSGGTLTPTLVEKETSVSPRSIVITVSTPMATLNTYQVTVSTTVRTAGGASLNPRVSVFQWIDEGKFFSVPAGVFSGEIQGGLFGSHGGLVYFSPALDAPAANSIIQVDTVEVCTTAYDSYKFPVLVDPTPLYTFVAGGTPSILGAGTVLFAPWPRLAEFRVTLTERAEEPMPQAFDSNATATFTQTWDITKVSLLNSIAWKIFDNAGQPPVYFKTADNTSPIGPGTTITVSLQGPRLQVSEQIFVADSLLVESTHDLAASLLSEAGDPLMTESGDILTL